MKAVEIRLSSHHYAYYSITQFVREILSHCFVIMCNDNETTFCMYDAHVQIPEAQQCIYSNAAQGVTKSRPIPSSFFICDLREHSFIRCQGDSAKLYLHAVMRCGHTEQKMLSAPYSCRFLKLKPIIYRW